METILKQIPLASVASILSAHYYALEISQKAGVAILEQISFATRVSQYCAQNNHTGDTLIFSLVKNDDVCILKAYAESTQGPVLVEIPKHAAEAAISVLTGQSTNVS